MRYKKRWYRVRRTGRYQIKVINKWSYLRRVRGRWYVKYKKIPRRVIRQGTRWYIRYARRLYRLRRTSKTLRIRFRRGWRRLKVRTKGRKKRLYILYGRLWRPIATRFTYRVKYKGRSVLVKKRGKRFRPRYRGRWLKWRRGYRRKLERVNHSLALTY